MGVTANQVTVVGILLAGVTGVMIGLGRFWIGVVLLTVGGLMDTLDGVVAKAAGTASKRGAFFDSVADRVADALIFGGMAWYLASGHNPRLALLPFAILGVSAVISYERAKAESLGYDAKGGLMERAERLILLGIALALHIDPRAAARRSCWRLSVLHRCAALREGLAAGEPRRRRTRPTPRGDPGGAAVSSRAGRSWRQPRTDDDEAPRDHGEPDACPPAKRAARCAVAPRPRDGTLGRTSLPACGPSAAGWCRSAQRRHRGTGS